MSWLWKGPPTPRVYTTILSEPTSAASVKDILGSKIVFSSDVLGVRPGSSRKEIANKVSS